MSVNKVVYGNKTLIDLSNDTVTSDKLARGCTAHDKAGNVIVGTMSANKRFAKGVYKFNISSNANGNDIQTISYTIPIVYGINSLLEFPFSNNSLTEPMIETSEIQHLIPFNYVLVLCGGSISTYDSSGKVVEIVSEGSVIHNMVEDVSNNQYIDVTIDDVNLVVTITTNSNYLMSGDIYFTWLVTEQ